MTEQNNTLLEKYKSIQKIGSSIETPWFVYRAFGSPVRAISVTGTEISLGEDFVSVQEARNAVEWYVKNLGRSVKWSKYE